MKIGMYLNNNRFLHNPLIGEIISLERFFFEIEGRLFDRPYGFLNKIGKPSYIQNKSILMRKNKFYRVEVKKDEGIKSSSEYGIHDMGISIIELNEKTGKKISLDSLL